MQWFVVSGTAFVLTLALSACAPEVVRSDAKLTPASEVDQVHVTLQANVHLESSSGYGRDLPEGSVWELRGSIEQGRVYRRVDGILTVEGAQIHEAYLVLMGDRIVGFYLPVEQSYSPARESVVAKFK